MQGHRTVRSQATVDARFGKGTTAVVRQKPVRGITLRPSTNALSMYTPESNAAPTSPASRAVLWSFALSFLQSAYDSIKLFTYTSKRCRINA